MDEDKFLIRVYGDSLTCPRYDSGIMYHEIYQELLADKIRQEYENKTVYVKTRSRPDHSIINLYKDAYLRDVVYYGKTPTDVLIIHCGICDCAPRPIPKKLRDFISRIPPKLRYYFVRFLHNNRSRIQKSGIFWRLTKPEDFRKIFDQWIRKVSNEAEAIFVINIAPTTQKIEAHSPGLGKSIELFNEIIKDVLNKVNAENVNLIDAHQLIKDVPDRLTQFINQDDGHHLTKKGHEFYCEKLYQLLSSQELFNN